MPVYIEMPKLSDTMTEGTLLRWRKKKGDTVAAGDILAEVETDKATMEMEAFDDGILAEVYVQDGGKAAIGQKLALLLKPGEKAPEGAPPAASAAKPAAQLRLLPPCKRFCARCTAPRTPAPAVSGGRVKASPLAKKIAAAKGIDLSRITGTGPGSRIVARDVESAGSQAARLPPQHRRPRRSAPCPPARTTSGFRFPGCGR